MECCILCGRPMPADTRWAIWRVLNPRPPFCRPATEECYRGLARRLGYQPDRAEVERALANANQGIRGTKNRSTKKRGARA